MQVVSFWSPRWPFCETREMAPNRRHHKYFKVCLSGETKIACRLKEIWLRVIDGTLFELMIYNFKVRLIIILQMGPSSVVRESGPLIGSAKSVPDCDEVDHNVVVGGG